jgi:hypothetical protein
MYVLCILVKDNLQVQSFPHLIIPAGLDIIEKQTRSGASLQSGFEGKNLEYR